MLSTLPCGLRAACVMAADRALRVRGAEMKAKFGLAATVAVGGLLAGCGTTETVVTVKKVTTTTTRTGSQSLSDVRQRDRRGVVAIDSTSCSGRSIGTGFEVSPRLVATVEHVVDGATSISIKRGGKQVATARIIGSDPAQDLALLLTDKPLGRHALQMARYAPRLGERVAAMGFPFGLPLSVTSGTVSGLNRSVSINNYRRHNLVQTDASA